MLRELSVAGQRYLAVPQVPALASAGSPVVQLTRHHDIAFIGSRRSWSHDPARVPPGAGTPGIRSPVGGILDS